MKRYLYLQFKRNLKIFPLVFTVAFALLLCISLILVGVINANKNSEKSTRLKVAISGDTQNELTQLGMAAIQTFDDTRFSMELVELPEEEAKKQLRSGEVSAVVIFPEEFIERAWAGEVDQVTFITTPGAQNVVSLLKDELTKVIADIAIACERGTYAVDNAITQNDLPDSSGKHMNALGLEYVDLVFARSEVYTLDELGISQGLDLGQYYVCSMLVFLLMLFGICFVTVCVKGDHSLSCLLSSKGFSSLKQLLCEFIVHFFAFCTLVFVLLLSGVLLVSATDLDSSSLFPSAAVFLSLCVRIMPVLFMLSAFNVMIFELSDDLISGALLHFFSCIGLCYISGCFFPVYTLPQPLQRLSHFLPTGIAREFLESAYSAEPMILQPLGILAFSTVFLFVAILMRHFKTLHRRG